MSGAQDMKAHEATYAGVMAMVKWGTIACIAIAALVVLIISN